MWWPLGKIIAWRGYGWEELSREGCILTIPNLHLIIAAACIVEVNRYSMATRERFETLDGRPLKFTRMRN